MIAIRDFPRVLTLLFLMVLVAGCSTGGQKITHSGFLGGYSKLQKLGSQKNAAIWVSPNHESARYREVIVTPVDWLAPHRDKKVEHMLQTELRDRLVTGISKRYGD